MWLAISVVVLGFIIACVMLARTELSEECLEESKREGLRKEAPLYKRSIGLCMFLSEITFGIYGIYWMYLLIKNIHYIQKNTTSCTREMLCLIFVPFYHIYWWYTEGAKVKQYFNQHSYDSTNNEFIYSIFAIFGLSIVSMAIMQSNFNTLKFEACSE